MTRSCLMLARLAVVVSGLASPNLAGAAEDPPNTHNMAIVGTRTAYVSHLPMFDAVNASGTAFTAPHRFQVIMAVDFRRGGRDADPLYTADRSRNPQTPLYTLGPSEEFVLTRLVKATPPLTQFKATVFRGHLEKRGKAVPGLEAVDVAVRRIVHFREFDPRAVKPRELRYILFGGGGETFLAHWISGPPDFDQLVAVKIEGTGFTDAELAKGIVLTIAGRANTAARRLRAAEAIAASTVASGTAAARPARLTPVRELYFEEGELFVPPQMPEDTPLETEAARRAGG